MKQIFITATVLGAALSLAACAPAAEESEDATNEVAVEEASEEGAMAAEDTQADGDTEAAPTGEVDPDGNPVDQ